MQLPPQLLRLESCLADYTVKATLSGITILKQNRFRKRYTGSKTHAVDINGKLWVDANELKKITGPERVVTGKKKGPVPPGTGPITNEIGYEITDFYSELPTNEVDFFTNLPDLSTDEPSPEKKGYRINKREVRQRLLGMINTRAGKKELYFWTITFPKGTPDDVAYQAFNTWLTTLRARDKYNGRRYLKNYLWVAERQDGKRLTDPTKTATNTIHFHIAIPHKMPVQKANSAMQTILKNLATAGKIPFTVHQCKRYNGVDIAKNRNTKRVTNFAIKKGSRALTTYLTKYIAKNDDTFPHLAWHNSRGFSALFTGITFTKWEFERRGEMLRTAEGAQVAVKWTHLLISDRSKWFDNEYFIFIPWAVGPPHSIINHLADLNSYLQDVTAKN